MKKNLPATHRLLILLVSLAMFTVLGLPIWKIELSAPQYPEGLTLKIYANYIGGDVDVINGLNHYIGMATLHTKDFVEFTVLPYIIGGFAALGILVVLINRQSAFYAWALLFVLIAVVSMVDFYWWEYKYGHHLNPDAPIKVPGMAYQPPLIGYKQLLNFGAYSIPDMGGWVFIGAGIFIAGILVAGLRLEAKGKKRQAGVAALLLLCCSLQGCKPGPEPIRYGSDDCAWCKMTFADRRFGAEICTDKGKVYKFDDLHCLLASLQAGIPQRQQIAAIYLVNFVDGSLVRAEDAVLMDSQVFQAPMGGHIAAFGAGGELSTIQEQYKGKTILWKDIYH